MVRIEGWFLWYDNDALRCGNLNSLYASKGLLLYPNAGRAEVDRHTKETQKEHAMNTVFRTCTENVADAQRTQWLLATALNWKAATMILSLFAAGQGIFGRSQAPRNPRLLT
ncbi:MAG: hypothetical protein ACPIOQ_79030, partial [Promethearchaeia archaeon]